MRSLHDFFVRMPKAFNEELKIGDKSIYLDPKWNEFENRKMSAEVYAVPEKYNTGVKPGDTLYFHHHVVISNEGKGQLLEDDIYFVRFDPYNSGNTQAYAYKCQDTGEIHLLSEWIFLTPEEQEDEEVTESGIITELKKPEYNMFGYVLYDSPAVQELGLKKGDKVMIMKNADYRMEIDGEEVYRTHITQYLRNWILMGRRKKFDSIYAGEELLHAMSIAIENITEEIKKPVDKELSGSQRRSELQSIKQSAIDAKELITEYQKLEQMLKELKKTGNIKEEVDYSSGFSEKFAKK